MLVHGSHHAPFFAVVNGVVIYLPIFVCAHKQVNGQGEAGPDGTHGRRSTQVKESPWSGTETGAVWTEQWGGQTHTKCPVFSSFHC